MSQVQWGSGVPIGDLLIGERQEAYQGVCRVVAVGGNSVHDPPTELRVLGEGGHLLDSIPTDRDPKEVDERIKAATEEEMARL